MKTRLKITAILTLPILLYGCYNNKSCYQHYLSLWPHGNQRDMAASCGIKYKEPINK